ncbi:MAG: S26 family signal peptidase [Betaproteobacteria bacterium]|nr:S26 family signal peptidase [Betaproteobacteria bacterium]
MNAGRLLVALFTGLGIAALAWPSVHTPVAHIVYNPSDSVPRGWYRVGPADSLHVGSIVLARLPADAAALAAQRGYLPEHIPLLKRIGAMSPQQVCIEKHIVRISGVAVTGVRATDGRGRPLLAWRQCRQLRDGELFLLSATNPASFDSRYFGPIAVSAVMGSAQPLWTWDTP